MKMKTLFAPFAFCALALAAQQASAESFNHSWLKRGAVSQTCYHDPCSVGKVVSFQKTSATPAATTLNITLLGGEKPRNSSRIKWNSRPHTITVVCSKQRPTITSGRQETVILLNTSMGVPGVLVSDAELYMRVCHNYDGSLEDGAARFGYDVQEDN